MIAFIALIKPLPVAACNVGNDIEKLFGGVASWYGGSFHGRRTASGSMYDMNKLTCAHKTLPFGTKLLVFNPQNGKKVEVVVTDRGPYVGKRVIDLSKAAADRLCISGISNVVCYAGKRVLSEIAQTVRIKNQAAPRGVAHKTADQIAATKVAASKLALRIKPADEIHDPVEIAEVESEPQLQPQATVAAVPSHQFAQTITISEVLPDAFATTKEEHENQENTRVSTTVSIPNGYVPI